ncbi:hypothetical protein [uncultured Maritimibacter sp.]|uniref:hypothetical protein n=1 Tax=uncultured Maritimibacter sp. TaxID=991866 RepID=UPI0025969AA3|nr:hypothetical protein [uncultured Maritimibacter sp.]
METATQSLERDMRMDHRKREAVALGHAIVDEIRDMIHPHDLGEVRERIFEALYRNGVMLIRDEERAKLGLESRDKLGWTPSERVQFEHDRFAAMAQMTSFVVDLSEPNPNPGQS